MIINGKFETLRRLGVSRGRVVLPATEELFLFVDGRLWCLAEMSSFVRGAPLSLSGIEDKVRPVLPPWAELEPREEVLLRIAAKRCLEGAGSSVVMPRNFDKNAVRIR